MVGHWEKLISIWREKEKSGGKSEERHYFLVDCVEFLSVINALNTVTFHSVVAQFASFV